MVKNEEPYILIEKEDPWIITEQEIKQIKMSYNLLNYRKYFDEIGKTQYDLTNKNDDKIFLSYNNTVKLPEELTKELGWKIGDEVYADIFDEELKQIVVGKKLEREDAVKALDKITHILND